MKKLLCIFLSITMCCCFASCSPAEDSQPETDEPGIAEPANGYVFEGITAYYESSTLKITTVGIGGHYFILDPVSIYCNPFADSSMQTKAEMDAKYRYIKFYVHGESTIEIQIPWGEYRIYYATGENWYGDEDLFGEDTVYSKISKTFNFTNISEYELRIPDGNLSIYKIEANEFPN